MLKTIFEKANPVTVMQTNLTSDWFQATGGSSHCRFFDN